MLLVIMKTFGTHFGIPKFPNVVITIHPVLGMAGTTKQNRRISLFLGEATPLLTDAMNTSNRVSIEAMKPLLNLTKSQQASHLPFQIEVAVEKPPPTPIQIFQQERSGLRDSDHQIQVCTERVILV